MNVTNGHLLGCFFCFLFVPQILWFSFILSSQTEVGSAGEQPARDILDVVEIHNEIAVEFSSTAIFILMTLCLQKLINKLSFSCC